MTESVSCYFALYNGRHWEASAGGVETLIAGASTAKGLELARAGCLGRQLTTGLAATLFSAGNPAGKEGCWPVPGEWAGQEDGKEGQMAESARAAQARCAQQHENVVRRSNGTCAQCDRDRQRLYRRTHRDIRAAQKRRARLRNPEPTRAASRRRRRLYPHLKLAERAKERADKLHRTPAWADLSAIAAIYRGRPPGCHVDHIYPLKGSRVSGLHVAANLRYLSPLDNMRKGSRMPPTLEFLC